MTCNPTGAADAEAYPTNLMNLTQNGPISASDLKTAIERGPVVTGIAAGSPYFQGYMSGIVNDPDCWNTI